MAKIQEPHYVTQVREGDFEVRQYGARVVAETTVPGEWNDAGNEGFRRLAGYIFGKNKGEKKFAMTAPVTQTAASAPAPVRMDMTAPVTQAAVAGGTRVQFVLPKGVTLATAPEPIDPRVQLRVMPAATWPTVWRNRAY